MYAQTDNRDCESGKILVIDDEPVLRETFKHLLENEGYCVWVAEDGVQGVEMYRDIHPDLVITDVLMPNRGGQETVAIIRAEEPSQPIIVMSAVQEPDDLDPPANADAYCFLRKPVDLQVLLDLVGVILTPLPRSTPDSPSAPDASP